MEEILFNSVPSMVWKEQIKKEFNSVIKGRYGCLDHFAVNLITPNNGTINICSNATYIQTYTHLNIQKCSSGLSLKLLQTLPVIPWRLLMHRQDGKRLNQYLSFKEVLHGLYSGMSFIHKMDNFYLNVAVASYSKNIENATIFLNNAEDILNLGAYFLDRFHNNLHSDFNLILPNRIEEIVLLDKHFEKIEILSKDWQEKNFFIYRDSLKSI